MTIAQIYKELDLLKEYMNVYIQLLPYSDSCGCNRLFKSQLPTFEYFKKTYSDQSYSLAMPHFKEAKSIRYDRIVVSHISGIGSINGLGYRHYNYWMRCKYFTYGNIKGDYEIDVKYVNERIKKL